MPLDLHELERWKQLPADPRLCLHSYAVQKKWVENGVFHEILRCRRYGCDTWTRKSMVLNQDSRSKTVKMHTQKFVEEANTDDK